MSDSPKTNTTDIRTLNMKKRRDRILSEARRMIGEGGFESLNLRALAGAADVTVPTIYNLIGNKEQILILLVADVVERVERALNDSNAQAPLDMGEAVVMESTALFASDENFYRAAFVANEYLTEREAASANSKDTWKSAVRLPTAACLQANKQGLLCGNIATNVLGDQMFSIYRTALRDWAFKRVSLESFRRNALFGIYVCLAADATDIFHAQIIKKINALGPETGAFNIAV
ncbi:MAG: TetR/AcrR family transcriptional regulator [Proteobacteria bacterium]|nr:TetR/AcrR family transcriptional regulator [Pseudomonadota bacterium]